MGKKNYRNNYEFIDSLVINNQTYIDFLERFKKVALSIYEWVNLPKSMNAMYLEKCLYYNGQATMLKDKNYGFINTRCSTDGSLNIYGIPNRFNCYSYEYQTTRKLYTGLEARSEAQRENLENSECILVMNNWDRIPTAGTMELFAYRLYEAERASDVNIRNQKYPYVILTDDKQLFTMKQLYQKIDGNEPIVFGDKKNLNPDNVRVLKTESPYVADKLQEYKKEIWNEALTFLGINNIMIDKKERLITDEANSNNELINLNLQSYLAPREQACKEFNEKFGLTGTDKEISVRVRSDLHNIIKNAQSVVQDFKDKENIEDINVKEEVQENG